MDTQIEIEINTLTNNRPDLNSNLVNFKLTSTTKNVR